MRFRLLGARQIRSSRPGRRPRSSAVGIAFLMISHLANGQEVSLPFSDILFVERGIIGGSEYNGFHFCDEYFGHNGRTGGGLFLLKDFQSKNRQKVDIVAGLKVPNGKTNAGQALSSGTFLSPDLSYDGKTVVFAWSSGGSDKWTAKNRFHLFKVNIDGTNLVQLTDGDFDDMHPAWMPNDRIVFISTRRGGYGRCHGRAVPTYTLHSMNSDGTDIVRLSEHETNEFHPSIANDGRIVYMRWDYIDRDALAAHHIWFCNPDGTNPRSWGGNYSFPLDTMTGGGPWTDGRKDGKRPQSEFYPRAIPGSSTKFVFVAGPHHGEAYGTLMIRDFAKVDDNRMGQLTKLTPDVGMPETAENGSLTYGPAWPLSETLYLTSYNNTLVLLDAAVQPVKRTQFYQTSNNALRPIYPIPVAPRTRPPVIAETTYQGMRWFPTAPVSTVQIANVYVTDAYGKLPDGVKIKSLRVVQVLSKTTPNANEPRLGYSSQNVAKLSLGTVPVEEDGSVFFEGPIGKLILFQLLDEKGMAVQSMRSATYLHPGENMTCTGCHEDKMAAPPAGGTPSASKRAASKMEPELGRVEPINYARYVVPVLKKCFSCHQGKNGAPTNTAYSAMQSYAFWFAGDANGNLEAVHGGSRSKPGMIGARNSRMGKALLNSTHQQALADGKFTESDRRTLTQWLDLGSDELGSYDNAAAQRRGEVVWPTLDLDKNDPQGLTYKPESKYVPAGGTSSAGGNTSKGGAVANGGQTGSGTQPKPAGGGGASNPTTAKGGAVANGGQSGAGTQPKSAVGGDGSRPNTTRASAVASGGSSNMSQATSVGGLGLVGSTSKSGAVTAAGTSGLGDTRVGATIGSGSSSGCTCRAGASSSGSAGPWALLLVGLTLLRRGRRK